MKKEFLCSQDYWPLIPDGTYTAQCIGYDEKFTLGKARKVFLNFKILDDGEHYGKIIFQAFNMRYDKTIRPGSKYYKTWVMVNSWMKPSRNAKMSPRVFLHKVYKIKVRTVKPIGPNGKEMPEDFWYSVVDSIIDVIAGARQL